MSDRERFTDRSRKVIFLAEGYAKENYRTILTPQDILYGLLTEGSGIAANVLKFCGVNEQNLTRKIERYTLLNPEDTSLVVAEKVEHTSRVKAVFANALLAAKKMKHNYIGTEHLLLGLLQEEDSVAKTILQEYQDTDNIRDDIYNLLGFEINPKTKETIKKRQIIFDLTPKMCERLYQSLNNTKEEYLKKADFETAAIFRDLMMAMKRKDKNLPWSDKIGRFRCCLFCGDSGDAFQLSDATLRCLNCNEHDQIKPELYQEFAEDMDRKAKEWCEQNGVDYEEAFWI